jgi:hypothetical protein
MENIKRFLQRAEGIIYSIEIGGIILLCVLDLNNYIEIKSGYAFIGLGIMLLSDGIFGLINKVINLTRGRPLKYNEKSTIGKIVNIIICIFGIGYLMFGIVLCILE